MNRNIDKCDALVTGGHQFEASTKVYLDISKFHIADNGDVIIDDISPSHLNDEYRGERMDLEANFTVSCANCGKEFDYNFSNEFRENMGLQPIGDAPRTLGKRGGLDG